MQANGTYSFADTPPAGGTVTYKVTYAGDAGHAAVSASDKVSVSRAATSLSLNNNGKLYSYGADVKFHRAPRQDLQEPHGLDLRGPLRRRQAEEAHQDRQGQLQRQPHRDRGHDPRHRRLRGLRR
ncbi:Ig-like domain-containing protein [Streptomyces sp. L7]